MIRLQGSQEALSTLFLAMCDPGDIVLVPDPYYPTLVMGQRLQGLKLNICLCCKRITMRYSIGSN